MGWCVPNVIAQLQLCAMNSGVSGVIAEHFKATLYRTFKDQNTAADVKSKTANDREERSWSYF